MTAGPGQLDTLREQAERALSQARAMERAKQRVVPKAALRRLRAAEDRLHAALQSQDPQAISDAIKRLAGQRTEVAAATGTKYRRLKRVLLLLGLLVLLRVLALELFYIPSHSMQPTLTVGDSILVNKLAYGLSLPGHRWIWRSGTPQRGDLIVFSHPKEPGRDYVKRVIGIAGDRISLTPRGWRLNGEAVPHRHLGRELGAGEGERYEEQLPGSRASWVILKRQAKSRGAWREMDANPSALSGLHCTGRPWVCEVKPGFVFVMGDHRDDSADSRVFGAVPTDQVIGRVCAILWSWRQKQGFQPDRFFKSLR